MEINFNQSPESDYKFSYQDMVNNDGIYQASHFCDSTQTFLFVSINHLVLQFIKTGCSTTAAIFIPDPAWHNKFFKKIKPGELEIRIES